MYSQCINAGCRLAVLLPVLVWIILFSDQQKGCFAQETSLKERFLAEVLPKRDEYARFARRLQGTATFRVDFDRKGKKESWRSRYEYKQNARCASILAEELEPSAKRSKKLSADNPDYSFELKGLQGADISSSWIVTTIGAPDSTLQRGLPLREEFLSHVMPQYNLDSKGSRLDIVRSRDFIVENAEAVPRDGRNLVRVAFQYRQQKKLTDRDYIPIQGGTMLLDPDHHWCPLERTLTCKWANGASHVKERFEYKENDRGFYIIERMCNTYQVTPYGSKSPYDWEPERVLEYDLHEASGLPDDSGFRLSAYGLPEPARLRRSTPWYLWALAGGAICLALGFFIRRRIRQGG